MDKVHFAVLGYGRIGKRHAEMILQHPEASLSALIDTDIQKQNGNTSFHSSIEEAVNTCSIDVVSIATPNGLHAQHALHALSLSKHVVVEKPMALSAADAKRIVEKAKEVGKHVFVVMQNRYSSVIRWLKEVVDSGVLGSIYLVQTNCFWNRNEAYYQASDWHGKKDLDGGTLFTQFSHFIDLLYWLFGDITNIQSRFYNYNHKDFTEFEDSGVISFEFKNGAAGSLQFTTSVWDKSLESSVTIIAEKGSIKIGGQYMDQLEYCHVKDYELPALNGYKMANPATSNHYHIIDDVVQTLKHKKTSGNISDAVQVVDVIERMYQSTW